MVKKLKIYDGRESFYQWDLNQQITSNTFKVGDEIHFFNIRHSDALVTIAYEKDGKVVADVPNVLLQSSHPLIVYRYINNDKVSLTIEEYQFKITQRPKPSDYVYTETEVLNYRTLDKRITAIEENGGSGGVEVDPTVPDWAKQPKKPTYTADEIGAYTKGEVDIEIGKAVAEAVKPKEDITNKVSSIYNSDPENEEQYPTVLAVKEFFGSMYLAISEELNQKADKSQIGDIETALENIIVIQNSLIGGDSV